MSIKVTSRTYYENHTNEQTDWLLGNVGDWQTLQLVLEASVDFDATISETIETNQTNKTLRLNNGKKWQDYGFDIGQVCKLKMKYEDEDWGVVDLVANLTIVNIYDDTIEVSQLLWTEIPDPIMTQFPPLIWTDMNVGSKTFP